MILFKRSKDLSAHLDKLRKQDQSVGFVPTMGALHPGHLSLITTSRKTRGITVASIFINPTQFNNRQDLEKYPITLEKDIVMLEKNECDILYLPGVSDVYPNGMEMNEKYPLGSLETMLEGEFRPGHFQGVCQVVNRLLDIVMPTDLFIGQKDYQQCMVISRLVELKQLPVCIHICETLREGDGLAMSSRNMRLNEEERKKAIAIYTTLKNIKQHYRSLGIDETKKQAMKFLIEEGFKPDYVEIVDARNLSPVGKNDTPPLVALIAAWLHDIRLIDNFVLS